MATSIEKHSVIHEPCDFLNMGIMYFVITGHVN
jgi:hypothetical protein